VSKFGQVVVFDFEYEVEPGNLPVPLCAVWHVLDEKLQHVHTIRQWRDDFGSRPPIFDPDTLAVAYSAWAELTCFIALGWEFPKHIFDLHTAYLYRTNTLVPRVSGVQRKKETKKLPDACRYYGISGWENIDKGSIAEDIGQGRWRLHGREAVLQYCEEDVVKSVELLRAQVRDPEVDNRWVKEWSNYSAKAVARIQARGIPIDTHLWQRVQENRDEIIAALIREFDPTQGTDDPIYTADGSLSIAAFERNLPRLNIHSWPRLPSGQLDMKGDSYRLNYAYPHIEGLHGLKDSLGFIAHARLPIGKDGRNRASLFPYGTATGRNAHARSPFNAHAGVRGFIKYPTDSVGAYLDWRTQEVGVAAALSGDEALVAAYNGGDVYHSLAHVSGYTNEPDWRVWKKANPGVRDRMKKCQLAINYGMSVPSLARSLGRHPLIASGIIDKYQRAYPVYCEWRERQAFEALLRRHVESVFGWKLRITTSPNLRSLYNFPMQAGGADMLRLCATRLCDAGIIPNMLVHDALLVEVSNIKQLRFIEDEMRRAGRDVCNGLNIGASADQVLRNGDRYRDKRPVAIKLWNAIVGKLHELGALSEREHHGLRSESVQKQAA
jgi:hypothetical protein